MWDDGCRIRTIMAEREHSKPMAKAPAKTQPKAIGKLAKAKLSPARAAAPVKPSPPEGPAAAVKRLETRNSQLAAALKDAQARIAELERQRDSALDRIEWVIDSLHSLREEQD
jgi:hypothetical protein